MSKHSVSVSESARQCALLIAVCGRVSGLLCRFAELRRGGSDFPLIVIQEAGLDGFWIHRVVQSEGLESHVVDAADDPDLAPASASED